MGIASVGLAAGAALGYLIADFDGDTMHGLARIVGSVGLLAALLLALDNRRGRQLERLADLLDEERERERRWNALADAINDLSGIDGESSTDSGHLPRRP